MMPVDIVVRAYNDMPVIEETLRAVRDQREPGRVLVMDNESQDGTTAIANALADRVINIPAGTYIPGAVLNQAMENTESDCVVFLNSDCTPLDDRWLETLLAGFNAENVAAVFGRQMPRPDCLPLFAKDTDDTFGNGAKQAGWRHCFSMASSAIRRRVWQEMPFNPNIQYSEDIEWTWRARQRDYAIRYCPESRVYHSHNYTLKQWFRRQYGEGKADAEIFDWPAWDRSWMRYSGMPFVRQILSDWKYALKTGATGAIAHSPALRFAQMLGRRKGFNAGLKSLGFALLLTTLALTTAPAKPPDAPMRWVGSRPWEEPEPSNAVPLTLQAVMTSVFASAPGLEAADARLTAAQRALGIQRSAYWPTITVNAAWGQDHSDAEGTESDTYTAGVGATWELFDGFRREFETLQTRHQRDAVALLADEARRLLQRAVTRAFFGALLAQDRMTASRGDYAFNNMMLELVSKRYQTGTASRSEVLNFKIRVTEDIDAYLTQRQLFAFNLTALEALMDTGEALSVDTHRLVNPHPDPIESMVVNLDQEVEYARHARADLRAQAARIAAARAGINAARGRRLPSLSLDADYALEREDNPKFQAPEESVSFVGLTLDWDIFSGGDIHHAIGQAKALLQEADATYRDQLRELERELKQYERILEHARMRVTNGLLACDAATEDRDMVTQLYQAGLVAVTRLNEVQKDVAHSLERLVQARVLFSQTWEELRIASGRMRPEALTRSSDPERMAHDAAAYIDPGQTRPIPIHEAEEVRPE